MHILHCIRCLPTVRRVATEVNGTFTVSLLRGYWALLAVTEDDIWTSLNGSLWLVRKEADDTVVTQTFSNWKARVQTLGRLEDLYDLWAIMRVKLQSDAPQMWGWPDDLSFGSQTWSPKRSQSSIKTPVPHTNRKKLWAVLVHKEALEILTWMRGYHSVIYLTLHQIALRKK